MNDIFSVCQCSLSNLYTNRWWGHSDRNYYNQICLKFLHSGVLGKVKHCSDVLVSLSISQAA